ncbi:MAG: CDP-glucose 4,6-dehydratase [Magnetococcales bacterium]|nr:CDP-glucose 4,6-dehydratase [Magnetococcales bacterium]
MEGLDMNAGFWRGRRLFLTGHTGFKGSWLALWLRELGAEVTGYALAPPTQPSLFEMARVADGMASSVIADIRDGEALAAAMERAAPEVVVHMAAQPLVRASYRIPVETYATNVMGSVHLLEAVRRTPSVRAVINVTTDKCYENREWHWGYRENEPLGGYDPYSSSKACAELVTSAYRNSFFPEGEYARHRVAVASARAGNVIGGGDWAEDRLLPDFVRAILRGEPVVIRNPHATRPWQHVLEPLSGYLLLAQRLVEEGPRYASAWNFGPLDADARPVGWVAQRMCALWGEGAEYRQEGGEHPHEASFLKLDISKARAGLGWQPRWDLETALASIVTWTKAYRAGARMDAVCLEQIAAYAAHADRGSLGE